MSSINSSHVSLVVAMTIYGNIFSENVHITKSYASNGYLVMEQTRDKEAGLREPWSKGGERNKEGG